MDQMKITLLEMWTLAVMVIVNLMDVIMVLAMEVTDPIVEVVRGFMEMETIQVMVVLKRDPF